MTGLEEIAKDLNVSISLVSKVLNGRLGTTRVSGKTVDAIRNHAGMLGYRKNLSASALATGRQNVIGMFIHRLGVAGSGLVEGLIDGIGTEAMGLGQRLLTSFFSTDEQFEAHATAMHPTVVDGILVAGLPHPQLVGRLRSVQASGLPVVTLLDSQLDPGIVNVGVDQRRVGDLATSHLIEQGCRRIATIAVHQFRHEGYLAAHARAGLAVSPSLVLPCTTYLVRDGEEMVRKLEASGVEYDGIFAPSDQIAAGALNTLCRIGKRVPDDVRIVGVDNSPFCEFGMIPLSSISQEMSRSGQVAVQLLRDIAAGRAVSSVWLEPVLHIRRSSC